MLTRDSKLAIGSLMSRKIPNSYATRIECSSMQIMQYKGKLKVK